MTHFVKMFKKRGKKDSIRQRSAEGEEEDDTYDSSTGEALSRLKEEQELRKSKGGLDASILIRGAVGISGGEDKTNDELAALEGYGIKGREVGSGDHTNKQLKALIGESFGAATGVGEEEDVETVYMRQFVADKLGVKNGKSGEGGGSGGGGSGSGGDAAPLNDEDKLYQVPEDFTVNVNSVIEKAEMELLTKQGLSGGIAEVELPMAYKVKNIQATEQAKRAKMVADNLRKQGLVNPADSLGKNSALSGSLTANYSDHQRKYAEKMKDQREGHRSGDHVNSHGKRPPKSSDDDAVHRFRKQARR